MRAASTASAARVSGVPRLPLSPRVRSTSATRRPRAPSSASVPPITSSASSGCAQRPATWKPLNRAPSRSTARTARRRGRRRRAAAARRRAAWPSARRCSSSFRISIVRAAMPSTSPTGSRKPVSACFTTSGRPPASEPTTGTSQAMASRAERPNDSSSDGSRNTSASALSSSMRSWRPRKRTRSCRPRRCASAWADARSGPSPTMSSTDGTSRLTRSKMRTTSITRFTGRKFETWSRIFWSGRREGGPLQVVTARPRQ